MIRIEIIANQSVYSEVITNLENCVKDFMYSVIPLVHGRGTDSYKLGTTTWPETNFMLIAYAEDSAEENVRAVIEYIRKKFPTEGIKMFVLHER